jgi:hypothetical protein
VRSQFQLPFKDGLMVLVKDRDRNAQTRRYCVWTYVHDWDRLLAWRAEILDHVLDQHAALSDLALWRMKSVHAQGSGEVKRSIPVTISTLSLETSFTGCSPSEDMLTIDVGLVGVVGEVLVVIECWWKWSEVVVRVWR